MGLTLVFVQVQNVLPLMKQVNILAILLSIKLHIQKKLLLQSEKQFCNTRFSWFLLETELVQKKCKLSFQK